RRRHTRSYGDWSSDVCSSDLGRRLIYGGHVISLARALSFNGLANAFHITAINGGRHVSPFFAGCTVFAWSEVLATADLPGRSDRSEERRVGKGGRARGGWDEY